MIKELKYLFFILIISLVLLTTLKHYFSSENKIREIDINHNILNSSVLDSAILTLASPSQAAAFGVDWNGNGSELITTGRSDLSSTATSSVQSFGVKNNYSIKSV